MVYDSHISIAIFRLDRIRSQPVSHYDIEPLDNSFDQQRYLLFSLYFSTLNKFLKVMRIEPNNFEILVLF